MIISIFLERRMRVVFSFYFQCPQSFWIFSFKSATLYHSFTLTRASGQVADFKAMNNSFQALCHDLHQVVYLPPQFAMVSSSFLEPWDLPCKFGFNGSTPEWLLQTRGGISIVWVSSWLELVQKNQQENVGIGGDNLHENSFLVCEDGRKKLPVLASSNVCFKSYIFLCMDIYVTWRSHGPHFGKAWRWLDDHWARPCFRY